MCAFKRMILTVNNFASFVPAADAAATDWNAVAVDYSHYPTTQYANSGPYGTSIGATYEYSGGVNDHRPESPGDDKVLLHFPPFF